MAVTSTRRVIVNFTGDFNEQVDSGIPSANLSTNASSPGQTENKALSTGNNTITPPTGAVGVTIILPSGNTVLLTLKGVNGDTGIVLHLTHPTSIGLNGVGTFVISAASAITVRLVWS